jgi:hypothetical protein
MPRVMIVFAVVMLGLSSARAQTTQPVAVPVTATPTATPPAAPQVPPPAASASGTLQTAQPTTRPVNKSAEDMLRQMLQPQGQGAQPLKPLPDLPPATDTTSGGSAVDPTASTQPVVSEGTLRIDRMGRLTPSADGKTFEFTFESDGTLLVEPPMILSPNRKLMQLEDRVQNSYRDLKLRVTGEVFEYHGRNYLLLQRWSVVPDNVQPLQ